ncbi:MAG: prepilin-type N-terminal cleavage/methylation domain-containing protein [Alphaproteobacteria bacterium]|nr:prepilin-type N-terminal cleavage/methylation domain-containing protein [Alphaproteobacteria bacterium]
MISPPDGISRPDGSRRNAAGFTLLEILVVLAVLGLMAALVAARESGRRPALEARAAALTVAQALRTARGRAIASDRSVLVSVNPERRSLRVGEDRPLLLGPSLTVTLVGVSGTIRFAADGSSSGGAIDLRDGAQHVLVGVDWLTGRVSVGTSH